jgi:hypothetical protein
MNSARAFPAEIVGATQMNDLALPCSMMDD